MRGGQVEAGLWAWGVEIPEADGVVQGAGDEGV